MINNVWNVGLYRINVSIENQLSSSISGFTFRTSGSLAFRLSYSFNYEVLVSQMFVNKLSEEKYIQYRKK